MVKTTEEQKQMFDCCHNKLFTKSAMDTAKNILDRQLMTQETAVLANGGRFAVASKALPAEDITANIEAGIRVLPQATADEIRCESKRILRWACLQNPPIETRSDSAKGLSKNDKIITLIVNKER